MTPYNAEVGVCRHPQPTHEFPGAQIQPAVHDNFIWSMKDIVPVSLTTLGHTKPCVCVPGYQEEPVNGALVCSGIILSLKINCCVIKQDAIVDLVCVSLLAVDH